MAVVRGRRRKTGRKWKNGTDAKKYIVNHSLQFSFFSGRRHGDDRAEADRTHYHHHDHFHHHNGETSSSAYRSLPSTGYSIKGNPDFVEATFVFPNNKTVRPVGTPLAQVQADPNLVDVDVGGGAGAAAVLDVDVGLDGQGQQQGLLDVDVGLGGQVMNSL